MPDFGQTSYGDAAQTPTSDPATPQAGVTTRPRAHGNPHGKRSSWLLIGSVVAAFAVGGAALTIHTWWLFWVCVGVVVLAIPAGKAIRIMDDTVSWETSAALTHSTSPPPEQTAEPAGHGSEGSPAGQDT